MEQWYVLCRCGLGLLVHFKVVVKCVEVLSQREEYSILLSFRVPSVLGFTLVIVLCIWKLLVPIILLQRLTRQNFKQIWKQKCTEKDSCLLIVEL